MNFIRLLSGNSTKIVGSTLLGGSLFTISEQKEKKSIYDQPKPEILLQEDPSQLETILRSGRTTVTSYVTDAQTQVQSVVDKFLTIEKSFTNSLQDLKSKEEPLYPGAAYVAVGVSAGLLLARKRGFMLRTLLPVTFGAATFNTFFPQTSGKMWNKTHVMLKENEYTKPAVMKIENGVTEVKRTVNEIEKGISKSVENLGAKVSELTSGKDDGKKNK